MCLQGMASYHRAEAVLQRETEVSLVQLSHSLVALSKHFRVPPSNGVVLALLILGSGYSCH